MTEEHPRTELVATKDGKSLERAPSCVVQIYGGEVGRRIPLKGEDLVFGREVTCAVPVEMSTVSRNHARLYEQDSQVFLEDLGSTNGTFVNDREIKTPYALRNGDFFKLGGAVFKYIEGGNLEALYHEEVYRLTILDGLTGIANKREFLNFLEREMSRARRHGRPLTLALMDIDFFKKINDQHGHLAGDYVLKEMATVVNSNVRADELFARYGGEEFAAVLPETQTEEAEVFCEKVRTCVESHHFEFDGQVIPVTLSIGAVTFKPEWDGHKFIEAADTLLYRAKANGRNRCELA